MNIFAPLLFVLCLGIPLVLLVMAGIPRLQHQKLFWVALLALLMRVALSTTFELYPRLRICHEDAEGYEYIAAAMARYWHGLGPRPIRDMAGWYNRGYDYFGAGLMYVFGDYRLNLSIWNGLIGSLTVIVLYRLGVTLFHPAVALRAAMLLAFMPSMVLWSAVAIKDPLMMLLVATALYLYVRLRRSFSIAEAVLLAGVTMAIFAVRFYVAYFVTLALVGTSLIGHRSEGLRIGRSVLVAVVFLSIIVMSGLGSYITEGLEIASLDRVAAFRMGMATTANSGFGQNLDVSSPLGLATAIPIGLAVLLFGPFPWQMKGLLPLLMLPEMLLWWSLAPSLVRGLRFAILHAFSRTAPVLVFFTSLAIGYSISLGNVGAAVRQRTQIFVFLFIFVGLGQYVNECRKRRLAPDLLLHAGRA